MVYFLVFNILLLAGLAPDSYAAGRHSSPTLGSENRPKTQCVNDAIKNNVK